MSQLVQAEVTGHANPAKGVYLLELYAPRLALDAQPGQFLHIRCGDGTDPLLRRPISIHAVNRKAGLLRIMFQVVGKGTALLAEKQDGLLDVMGPQGSSFNLGGRSCGKHNNSETKEAAEDAGAIMVVGGGIGTAPLFFLLQELAATGAARRVKVLLGAKSAEQLLVVDQAATLGFPIRVATDDGSAGLHGPVTNLLAEELRSLTAFVYACGPAPMLKAVCSLLNQAGVPGEVSLEERMACGVGACLSCACRVNEKNGQEAVKRVCVDGPVFSASEVVWK